MPCVRTLAALALLLGNLDAQTPGESDPHGAPDAGASLQALVSDRPEFLTLMKPQDDVWSWLEVHFANHGWTIRWSNNQATLAHYLARHTYTTDGHPVIFIARQFRTGAPISAEAQLSGLVFELLNATHEDEFKDVAARGARGEMTRDEFILANARIEFSVCRATQDFYHDVWGPHVLRNHLSDPGGNWHLAISDDFDEWIAYHRRVSRDGYPDDVYGPEYDALTARHRAEEKGPAVTSSGT
jgi:hypothetical protein